MKLAVLINLVLTSQIVHAACPQIDPAKVYPDKIPYCPAEVQTDSAWAVMGCAFKQARTWHAATEPEKVIMGHLVQGLKEANSTAILTNTEALKLQVCRSQSAEKDSFLVMYTKPGVKDYSGPFLMYREGGQTSGIVLHSPHDGQESTDESTKHAFQDSNALALISNGHNRTLSGRTPGVGGFASDWAHHRADLGYTAFLAFKNKFAESVHLHLHGLAAHKIMVTDSVAWDGALHTLRDAFVHAAKKAVGGREDFSVDVWRFSGWITGRAMTKGDNDKGRRANQRWVGAEISVRLHENTRVVSKTVMNLEADYLNKPKLTVLGTPTS